MWKKLFINPTYIRYTGWLSPHSSKLCWIMMMGIRYESIWINDKFLIHKYFTSISQCSWKKSSYIKHVKFNKSKNNTMRAITIKTNGNPQLLTAITLIKKAHLISLPIVLDAITISNPTKEQNQHNQYRLSLLKENFPYQLIRKVNCGLRKHVSVSKHFSKRLLIYEKNCMKWWKKRMMKEGNKSDEMIFW